MFRYPKNGALRRLGMLASSIRFAVHLSSYSVTREGNKPEPNPSTSNAYASPYTGSFTIPYLLIASRMSCEKLCMRPYVQRVAT